MTVNSPDGPCKQRGREKGKAKLLSHPKHPLYHRGPSSKEPNKMSADHIKADILQEKP